MFWQTLLTEISSSCSRALRRTRGQRDTSWFTEEPDVVPGGFCQSAESSQWHLQATVNIRVSSPLDVLVTGEHRFMGHMTSSILFWRMLWKTPRLSPSHLSGTWCRWSRSVGSHDQPPLASHSWKPRKHEAKVKKTKVSERVREETEKTLLWTGFWICRNSCSHHQTRPAEPFFWLVLSNSWADRGRDFTVTTGSSGSSDPRGVYLYKPLLSFRLKCYFIYIDYICFFFVGLDKKEEE